MDKLCNTVKRYGPLVARILIAQLFMIAGVGKMASYAKTAALMASHYLPIPRVLLVFVIALEFGGGILLVLGWQVRWIAAALFGFTLIVSLIFHPFWAAGPQLFASMLNDFMKNLAIMGGMLYLIVYGAGPISFDRDDWNEPRSKSKTRKKR